MLKGMGLDPVYYQTVRIQQNAHDEYQKAIDNYDKIIGLGMTEEAEKDRQKGEI